MVRIDPTTTPTRAMTPQTAPDSASCSRAVSTASFATKPKVGDARHGRECEHRHDQQHGRLTTETAELAEVAGARSVVDDAHHEEERGLEQRVRDEQSQPGEGRVAGAVSDDDREEPELTDRAVGEHQLQVVLPQSPIPAEHHRHDADGDDDLLPAGRVVITGRQSCDEVDARLDHGGGVEVRADRRRAAMAAGSQKWNGTSADFDRAPTSTSTTATVTAVPDGGPATSSERELVPPCTARMTSPTSMARPPAVVTIRACRAAPRLACFDV